MSLPPFWPTDAAATWTATAAIATTAAFLAAAYYAYLTLQIFRRDQRPLVRMVRKTRTDFNPSRDMLLKNVGRGPAIGVCLIDHNGEILGEVDAVEPLGAGTGPEWERTGRTSFTALRGVDTLPGFPYFLVYQDIGGRWHATKLVPDGPRRFRLRFFRIRWPRRVPPQVLQRAPVRSAYEDVGGTHVLNTPWERHREWVKSSLRESE